jgi:hypothetical protein
VEGCRDDLAHFPSGDAADPDKIIAAAWTRISNVRYDPLATLCPEPGYRAAIALKGLAF